MRRRVQQDTTGHRARTGDPLYPGPQSLARLAHTGSPHANKNAPVRPSRQIKHTSVSTSPTTAPSKSETSYTKTHPPKANAWPHTSSSAYQPVPSPKSLAWAGPYASGRTPSWPTSTPAEPATGQQKPSTDIIELGRRTARGYRNPTNYKLRMLLIAGGLDASTHTQLGRAGKPPTFPSTPQKSDRSDAATQIETTAMSLRGRTISAPAVTRGNLGVELIC